MICSREPQQQNMCYCLNTYELHCMCLQDHTPCVRITTEIHRLIFCIFPVKHIICNSCTMHKRSTDLTRIYSTLVVWKMHLLFCSYNSKHMVHYVSEKLCVKKFVESLNKRSITRKHFYTLPQALITFIAQTFYWHMPRLHTLIAHIKTTHSFEMTRWRNRSKGWRWRNAGWRSAKLHEWM